MLRIAFLTLTALFLALPMRAQEESTRIVVFTPTTEDNSYWPQVSEILQAASQDLGVELLEYEFPVEDRYAKHTEGVEILNQTADVDGAIFSVAFGQSAPLLQAARRRNIPVFIQGPLFESELPEVGHAPRREYENWIGYFYQDEYEKALRLGELLIDRAARSTTAPDRDEITVVGIGGDATWYGSQERANGLEEAVRREPRAASMQIVPTHWTEADGRRVAAGLLDRYPETSVIWAASDQLAIGAVRTAKEREMVVGRDLFIGGLDLSPAGLRYVERGELTATVAASMLSYAQILVYLYDYIHGVDFAEEVGTEIQLEEHAATRETAQTHLRLYASVYEIDFKAFSKVYNAQRTEYDFSLDAYESALGE